MSTKKINAGDTLTVGDLTDDHLGAVIEVDDRGGTVLRFCLGANFPRGSVIYIGPNVANKWCFVAEDPVKVITPPPVVQPDEPTEIGQMFRVEGLPDARGFRARGSNGLAADGFWWRRPASGTWSWDSWSTIKERVGDHQIIVSDPPRWPDETPEAEETPVVPERIEVGEWPDDDTHLREWEWNDSEGDSWRWYEAGPEAGNGGWAWFIWYMGQPKPSAGPWTRGEPVK